MKRSERTDWFFRAKWGLFMHFLAEAPGGSDSNWGAMTIERWNRKVDAFDVEKLAAQLHELRAGYFYITLTQNSGYVCTPSATLDRLTHRNGETSRCSRRDLVKDLYEALKKYDIPLLVYLPTHAPMHDPEAVMALKCVPPWNFSQWSPKDMDQMAPARQSDPRICEFQQNWEAIMREWSLRWSGNVHGWWFDGCYYADRLYRSPEEPNFKSFAAAARAGNPKSMVCWNPGVTYPPVTISEEEDYTSGEVNEPEPCQILCRWNRQAQNHVLTYAGKSWGTPPIRLTPAELLDHTRRLVNAGGVVTWDVPFDHTDGSLPEEVMESLRGCGAALAGDRPVQNAMPPFVYSRLIKPPVVCSAQGIEAGQAKLKLFNGHDQTISGVVNFRIEPDGVFRPLAPIRYDIEPDQESIETISLEPLNLAEQVFSGKLVMCCGDVEQVFCFRCDNVMDANLLRRLSIGGGKKPHLADLTITVRDGVLQLDGTIDDPQPDVRPIPWMGSALEVFLMPERDFSRMLQLFLVPPADGRPAAVLRAHKDAYVPVEGAMINVQSVQGGYQLSALLPLSLIGSPAEFGLEMQLTVNLPSGHCKDTLFGSASAFTSPEFYARVKA